MWNSNSFEKVFCKKIALLKRQQFQKVTSFEKVVPLKNQPSRKSRQCGILLFWKISFFQNDAMQKYLLRKGSSSVDIFILNNSSAKMVVVLKSNQPEELPILKKWLLGRSFTLKKQLFCKNNCFRKERLFENGAYQIKQQLPNQNSDYV